MDLIDKYLGEALAYDKRVADRRSRNTGTLTDKRNVNDLIDAVTAEFGNKKKGVVKGLKQIRLKAISLAEFYAIAEDHMNADEIELIWSFV
jgi:hypothetical protein